MTALGVPVMEPNDLQRGESIKVTEAAPLLQELEDQRMAARAWHKFAKDEGRRVQALQRERDELRLENEDWKRTCGPEAWNHRRALEAELERAEKSLGEAIGLLDNARCALHDPALRGSWGRRRKALRSALSKGDQIEESDA